MSAAFSLPAELTIHAVAELRDAWLERLDLLAPASAGAVPSGAAPVVVDASPVADVDAAGLQLLAALSRAAAARGRPLALAGPSAPLRDASRTLGLAAALGLAPTGDER